MCIKIPKENKMQIQLSINDHKIDIFMEMLKLFKKDVIEEITILDTKEEKLTIHREAIREAFSDLKNGRVTRTGKTVKFQR